MNRRSDVQDGVLRPFLVFAVRLLGLPLLLFVSLGVLRLGRHGLCLSIAAVTPRGARQDKSRRLRVHGASHKEEGWRGRGRRKGKGSGRERK